MYLNKVILCGVICNEPVVRFTQKNVSISFEIPRKINKTKINPTIFCVIPLFTKKEVL